MATSWKSGNLGEEGKPHGRRGNLMGERQSRGKGVISWKKGNLMHFASHLVDFPGCHSKCCLEPLNLKLIELHFLVLANVAWNHELRT